MPVKKTIKKTTKPVVKKAATTTVAKQTAISTKAMDCKTGSCYGSVSTWTILLLAANTVLLLFLLSNYTIKRALIDMEIQRVGGAENYQLIQQIYELDNFKQQQKFQIEQTLKALQSMGAEQQKITPENTEFMPE
jgi:hypothetical protein